MFPHARGQNKRMLEACAVKSASLHQCCTNPEGHAMSDEPHWRPRFQNQGGVWKSTAPLEQDGFTVELLPKLASSPFGTGSLHPALSELLHVMILRAGCPVVVPPLTEPRKIQS